MKASENHLHVFGFYMNQYDGKHGKVKAVKPWGEASIAVWFDTGLIYKVKLSGNHVIEQQLSKEDVARKFAVS